MTAIPGTFRSGELVNASEIAIRRFRSFFILLFEAPAAPWSPEVPKRGLFHSHPVASFAKKGAAGKKRNNRWQLGGRTDAHSSDARSCRGAPDRERAGAQRGSQFRAQPLPRRR